MNKRFKLSLIFLVLVLILGGCNKSVEPNDIDEDNGQLKDKDIIGESIGEKEADENIFNSDEKELEVDNTILMVWEGEWNLITESNDAYSTIEIKDRTNTSFNFEVNSGRFSNTGFLEGKANIEGNKAYCNYGEAGDIDDYTITFELNNEIMDVKTGGNIDYYFGLNVYMDGEYKLAKSIGID